MAKTGLSYYQAETDRFQDIKVKRLKKRYGCEGYAVYQYIQNEIYRVEGCYIRFTDDQLFDVSEYWCIDEDKVEQIIEYCTEVELFDAITWHTKRVLTSLDVQQRYLEICRRAKKKIIIPEDIRLLEAQGTSAWAGGTGVENVPLPLFDGQEIETKTGKTTYGSPQMETRKDTVTLPGASAGGIIPQSSAEIPETPQNSAEKRHKEKESKVNPSSIPPVVLQAKKNEEEDKTSSSSGKKTVEPSPDEYCQKMEHLANVCRSMSCAHDDLRQILMIEDIARDDSPIWGLMEDVRHSGGQYSFCGYVVQSLRALICSGRLKVSQAEPVHSSQETRRLLAGIGVASYEMDEICEASSGKERELREAIEAVRRSKGKILMPGSFILSRLKTGMKIKKTA